MESKRDIRTHTLNNRKALTQNQWNDYSACINEKVLHHPFFLEATAIYCYVDYRQEVGTRAIIEEAWKAGKKVAVPRVEGVEMMFYYISKYDDLEEGYRGILEPKTKTPAKDESVLVIMPGAAFDSKRNRIGYGKGFYDKYLSKHSNYRTIALCFSCQIVEKIPADTYDIRPEVLITEEKIYDEFFAE